MSERIEEKIPRYVIIHSAIIHLTIVALCVKGINSFYEYGIASDDLAILIMLLLMGTPALLYWNYIIYYSATRLLLEDNILTLKLLFRKPIKIPLRDIYKIEIWGNPKSNRHFHIIRYGDKKFNTLLISFRISRSFDEFINELQRRVDMEKMNR